MVRRAFGRPLGIKDTGMNVLVTGAAGFIGFHLCARLLKEGYQVVGLDNLNDYYDPTLKRARLKQLEGHPSFSFHQVDIANRDRMEALFSGEPFARVVHLAAQAGVRYSVINPHAYADSNLTGFLNVLEGCRRQQVQHLIFASSSSVYGLNQSVPFSVHDSVDHPISLYAATKKANELMAHSYSHLFALPTTGLRFFTVYGPWGRPDMALFRFTRAILSGEPIDLYNHGHMQRDFTYIDDIVEGVTRVMNAIPTGNVNWDGKRPDPGSSPACYRIFNIGNNQPVELERFVNAIEAATGRTAQRRLLPMQPGDVMVTAADIDSLENVCGFRPSTSIETGVARFVAWFREHYRI